MQESGAEAGLQLPHDGQREQGALRQNEKSVGEKEKIRIEGYTRADNIAMRKCFISAGFVKEGYLRNAWENSDGTIYDTVLYGSIFEDWQTGSITPSKMNNVPY